MLYVLKSWPRGIFLPGPEGLRTVDAAARRRQLNEIPLMQRCVHQGCPRLKRFGIDDMAITNTSFTLTVSLVQCITNLITMSKLRIYPTPIPTSYPKCPTKRPPRVHDTGCFGHIHVDCLLLQDFWHDSLSWSCWSRRFWKILRSPAGIDSQNLCISKYNFLVSKILNWLRIHFFPDLESQIYGFVPTLLCDQFGRGRTDCWVTWRLTSTDC